MNGRMGMVVSTFVRCGLRCLGIEIGNVSNWNSLDGYLQK